MAALVMVPTPTFSPEGGDTIEVQMGPPADNAGSEAAVSDADSKPQEIAPPVATVTAPPTPAPAPTPEPTVAVEPIKAKPAPPAKPVKKAPAVTAAKPKPAAPSKSAIPADTPTIHEESAPPVAAETDTSGEEKFEAAAIAAPVEEAKPVQEAPAPTPAPVAAAVPREKLIPVKESVPAGIEADTEAQSPDLQKGAVDPAPAVVGTSSTPQATGELGKGGATKESAVSVLSLRQMPGNKQPVYPQRARLEQRQGQMELVYRVTREGRVADMQLISSTGSQDLDEEAIRAISKFKFVPGQEGWARHPVIFSLKGTITSMPSRLRSKGAQTE